LERVVQTTRKLKRSGQARAAQLRKAAAVTPVELR
jgi:hypothetical protein